MSLLFALLVGINSSAEAAPGECRLLHERPHAVLRQCGSLRVLTLEGHPVERARANGELLRDGLLSRDVVDYFATKIDKVLERQGFLGRWFGGFLYQQIVRTMHAKSPGTLAAELAAMAAGMGVEPAYLQRAISLPDIGAMINQYINKDAQPGGGCTSVAVRDREGSFSLGRNLDFGGAGYWDRHPLLVVNLPEAGSRELPHAAFSADGIFFGGVTGVNAAGIYYSLHQNYSRDAGSSAGPLVFLGEHILRSARSLDEALDLLRANRPGQLWTVVLADLRAGKTLAVEASTRHFSVREMRDGIFAQANHVSDPGVRKDELIAESVRLNSVYRMELAEREGRLGGPGAEQMARILAARGDESGDLAAYHDVIKAHTIQSVVIDAREGRGARAYLGSGLAPTASGSYVGFELEQLWRSGNALAYEELDLAPLAPSLREKQRAYSEAFRLVFDEYRYSEAGRLLQGQRSLDAALFRSIMHYKAGNHPGAAEEAGVALGEERFRSEPVRILESLEWVRLAALWQGGKKEEARSFAAALERGRNGKPAGKKLLQQMIASLVRGGVPPADALEFGFEFFSGDLSLRKE